MPFAAALSEHPVTAYATGDACGEVLEAIGTHPDLVLVFTTRAHAGALEDVVATVRSILHPTVAVGAASDAIVGTGREVEGGPGISVWAGRWGPVLPVHLNAVPGPDGPTVVGLPSEAPFAPTALLLVGDPFSLPGVELLDAVESAYPGLPVVGGMASGARGAGGNRLALDDRTFTAGAVGALLGPGVDVVPVVSQGCRPVGRPFVVTDGSGRIIRELAGRTALARLEEIATGFSPEELRTVNAGGLHIGRVVDERQADFHAGDFVVRNVLGGDRETGAIAVDDEVEIGTTVQFHLRDAAAAHEDLERVLLRDAPPAGADAAWLFTCNGRGISLFDQPDHDADLIAAHVGRVPTAGIFAAGEWGRVGARNEVLSFTASLLLFSERR